MLLEKVLFSSYKPDIKRFITKDLKSGIDTSAQSWNRYTYGLGNPISLVDISGFVAQEGEISQIHHSSSDIHNQLLLINNIASFEQDLRIHGLVTDQSAHNVIQELLIPGTYVERTKCKFLFCDTTRYGIDYSGVKYLQTSRSYGSIIGVGTEFGESSFEATNDSTTNYHLSAKPAIFELEAGYSPGEGFTAGVEAPLGVAGLNISGVDGGASASGVEAEAGIGFDLILGGTIYKRTNTCIISNIW